MTHPTEGELQAHLDGALSEKRKEEVAVHLRHCSPCREILGELRGFAGVADRALSELDTFPPPVRRARQTVRDRLAASPSRPRPRPSTRRWSRAAVVVLLLAATAGALMAEPVRSWLGHRWADVRELVGIETPVVPSSVLPPEAWPEKVGEGSTDEPVGDTPPAPAPVGVHLDAREGPLEISLLGLDVGQMVAVRLVDTTVAAVFTTRGRFTRGPGRLMLQDGADPITVELPQGNSSRLLIDGLVYVEVGPDGPEVLRGLVSRSDHQIRVRRVE